MFYTLPALFSAWVAFMLLEHVFKKRKNGTETSVVEAVIPSPHRLATDVSHLTVPAAYKGPEAAVPYGFSPEIGFKSFQTGDELTVTDIVKGLSRN